MEPRGLNYNRALWAGVVGGAVMTLTLAVLRSYELTELNLAMMLGAMFTGAVDIVTWIFGFLVHLFISGAIALVYCWIFINWGKASAFRGVLIAIPHAFIGGLFTWFLPAIHAAVPEHPLFIEPGFLVINYGWFTAAGFVALHLLYGAIVGGLLATSPRRMAPPATHAAART